MFKANDLEWATFLFNAMGEDHAYVRYSIKVMDSAKDGRPGKDIVGFLNHWRMRVSTSKIPVEIDKWYNSEGKDYLSSLPDLLQDIDLSGDSADIGVIYELYNKLDGIDTISDTSVSKILHILRPSLFVMWDNEIRNYYVGDNRDGIKTYGPEAYIYFLRTMQKFTKELKKQSPEIVSKLNQSLKMLYEGNLEQIKNESEKKDMKEWIEFLAEKGKPLTKFLDEYNWITITRHVKIPPAWHP